MDKAPAMRLTLAHPMIRAATLAAAGLLLWTAPAQPASAQSRADSAAVLLRTAADFVEQDRAVVAEALYRLVADRFVGTAAAELAREALAALVAQRAGAGGETELRVWYGLFGIWSGLGLPLAVGAAGPEPYGAGLLLGTSAGLLAGRSQARSRPFSPGQARAVTWGGTWGAFQGMALAQALKLGSSEWRYDDGTVERSEASTEAVVGAMLVGGTLGVMGGSAIARREINAGTATSAMLGSLWGAWLGVGLSVLTDAGDTAAWTSTMLLGDAGLLIGGAVGSRVPLTRSRARLISLGGLAGTVSGLGVALLADAEDEDAVIGLMLAGSAAGLAAGTALTRGRGDEEDLSQGAGGDSNALPPLGALVNRSDHGWTLGVPLASPQTFGGGDGQGLAWRVPLLAISER